ncbi:MAG: 30S ribosomal protein S13 [Candidatus Aenigmarchaeota archaeon]|nr:30S ribosomal protein S13 [Candidatus Aenigmarchaeota archaeon]
MGSKKTSVKDPEKEKQKKEKEDKKRPESRPAGPRQVIRVAGTDLDGDKSVVRAIRKIKGVGYNLSNSICLVSGINPYAKLSSLGEQDIKQIEGVIKNPIGAGVPKFLANRQRDMATGNDVHLTSSDLDVAKKFDVQRYVNLKTYRGWRHMFGQPVRGQRTRSTFRQKGKVVGVIRKQALQKAGAAPAAAAPASPAKAPENK